MIIPELEKRHWPLLVTHTQLRNHFLAERGLGEVEINYLTHFDGIIGLIPTHDMMTDLKADSQGCESSLDHFHAMVAEAAQKFGAEKVGLGSDVNAPLKGLSPLCENPNGTLAPLSETPGQRDLKRDGYYQYEQWQELSQYVAPVSNWSTLSRNHFFEMWKKVRP